MKKLNEVMSYLLLEGNPEYVDNLHTFDKIENLAIALTSVVDGNEWHDLVNMCGLTEKQAKEIKDLSDECFEFLNS